MRFFYIFLGGGIGSILRYVASAFFSKTFSGGTFPVGTFLVNVFGCVLIGIFSAFYVKADHPMRFLLITGLCGGFTTFSTFSSENLALIQNGNLGIAAIYSILSIVIGVVCVYFGFRLTALMQ